MPRAWLLLLLLIPGILMAQSLNDDYMFPGDETWEDPVYGILSHPELGMGGTFGTLLVDGVSYTQVRLRPELAIWKLGVGLDIDLLIDSEGRLRRKDWSNWQDILKKVFYLRFADRSDSLYFKAGSIPDYTLGHGLIFDDYSNMLRYPEEKPVGGYLGMNTNSFGFAFEVYTHDISKNQIIAGRASLRPLQSLGIPLLKNIKIGANLGADRNPQGKYPDADGDGYPDVYDKFPADENAWLDTDDDGVADNEDIDLNGNSILDHPDLNPYVDTVFPGIAENYPNYQFDTAVYPDSAAQYSANKPIYIYSLDYELPFAAKENFSLVHYGEYAVMDDFGTGLIWPGLATRFLIFDTKLELRHFSSQFLPAYFNNLYDEQRCQVVYTQVEGENGRRTYYLRTKDSLMSEVPSGLGWFGYLRANIGKFAYLKVAYQEMLDRDQSRGKSLWGKLTLMPEKFPKLKEASLYYTQANVDRIDTRELRNENAQVSGRVVYGYNDYYSLVAKYTEYYKDLDADGRIRGRDEVIESVSFGVEFKF